MKVLQVCAYAAPYEGNFMQSLFALEGSLSRRNVETIYCFPETAKELHWVKKLSARARIYFLPLAKAQILPRTYRLFRQIFRENPDILIVHSHFEQYDIPLAVTAPKRVKVYWHLHDALTEGRSVKRILMRFQYGFLARTRRIVLLSVSEKYRRDLIRIGFPEENSHTVINGLCLDRVRDCRLRGDETRPIDFVTFGWEFERKGDDLILQACDRLAGEGYRFTFVLNGGEQTWREVEAFYHGTIPDYVVFGKPEDDINRIFEKSRVYIQASRRETFAYAICEAAYAGLQVISSDIPGVEWAHALPTVRFFPSENAEALADTMRGILDGERITDDVIDKSREIVEADFSVEKWAETILRHYEIEGNGVK